MEMGLRSKRSPSTSWTVWGGRPRPPTQPQQNRRGTAKHPQCVGRTLLSDNLKPGKHSRGGDEHTPLHLVFQLASVGSQGGLTPPIAFLAFVSIN
jgi:hypothetical protein